MEGKEKLVQIVQIPAQGIEEIRLKEEKLSHVSLGSEFKFVLGEDNIFRARRKSNDESYYHRLPAGLYKVFSQGLGFDSVFSPCKGTADELIKFKDETVMKALNIADKFFSDKTKGAYKTMGLGHKVSILFYGKHGAGKTSTCYLIMGLLAVRYDAICLDCTGRPIGLIKEAIGKIREVQDNPVIIFYDEFDSGMNRDENGFLTLLDGSDSVSNFMFIGCTNYLDRVPARIRNRKSRIKYTIEISSFPQPVYEQYILSKMPAVSQKMLKKFAYLCATRKMTLDEVKNAVIDIVVDGSTVLEAIRSATKKTGDDGEDVPNDDFDDNDDWRMEDED